MILADLLNVSITLIFGAQVIVCLLLLGIILMQRPKNEGLGAAFGGDLANEITGAHTTTVLQKGTVYLGSLFMIFSFALALLIVHRSDISQSSLSQAPVATQASTQKETAPATPTEQAPKPLSNEAALKILEAQAPPLSPTPATPLVPAVPATPEAPTAPVSGQ